MTPTLKTLTTSQRMIHQKKHSRFQRRMPATIYRSLGLRLTVTTSKSDVLHIDVIVRLCETQLTCCHWSSEGFKSDSVICDKTGI